MLVKQIFKVLIFLSIVFTFDRIGGFCLRSIYTKSNEYTFAKLRYSLDSTNQDILIFGSSRVHHHFNPIIVEKYTGFKTYNCGFDGEGLLFSYIQLHKTLLRYKPKVVVLELSPNVIIDPDYQEKLNILLPYFKSDELIYHALTNNQPYEKIKFISSIYPFNSTIANLLKGSLKNSHTNIVNGFLPLYGTIDTFGLTNKINTSFNCNTIPLEKLDYLREFILLCHNYSIPLITVVSPIYQTNKNLDQMISQINTYCRKYNIVFFNFSKSKYTSLNSNLFKDNLHLNAEGAKFFSEDFSQKLNIFINTNQYSKRNN
jgi:hypothetical protein